MPIAADKMKDERRVTQHQNLPKMTHVPCKPMVSTRLDLIVVNVIRCSVDQVMLMLGMEIIARIATHGWLHNMSAVH